MKKILLFAALLIGLLGLSSCNDKSTFMETEEFMPYCYAVKDANTIQVLGYKSLVIEEVEKSNWQLYVQYSLPFIGNEPLKIENSEINLMEYNDKNSVQLDLYTNMSNDTLDQEVSFAVGGLLHQYTYMGEEQQLTCISSLKVKVDIVVGQLTDNPFFEKGEVVYSLLASDSICLARKNVPFIVASTEYYREHANK